MSQVKVYSPLKISIVVGGFPIDSGFGEDEFLKIEQAEEDWVSKVGIDGEITIAKTNNSMTKVTITLMQSSKDNAILSGLRALSLAQNATAGPFLARDQLGTSLYAASDCWFSKPPDAPFARLPTERVWVLYCNMDTRFDGGN